ncbi:DUF2877 domain-containing protein [Oscillospiraceae bacterium MB08-C2-2]|nr:DUF2877 domain-containing protein [Oscillospiraceae bacterium MB08-C2-2]
MGTVHSCYGNVVNLLVEQRLYALHAVAVAATPISLVTDGWDSRQMEQISAGQEARFLKDGLLLGTQRLSFKGNSWEPRLSSILRLEALLRICCAAEEILPHYKERGGFGDLVLGGGAPCGSILEQVLAEKLTELQAGVKQGQEKFAAALKSLVGLGTGLTPSGDDFLVGMLFVFWSLGAPGKAWLGQMTSAFEGELGRTNTVSAAFLRCALAGEFGEKLHRLHHCVDSGHQLGFGVEAVAQTGHSSGIDTLSGIVCAARIALENSSQKEETEEACG